MSNEIFDPLGVTGRTVYAQVFNSDGKVRNTASSAFETYSTANRTDYDIALTEQGTASGIYIGDFPSGITSSGTYQWISYIQAGASPAETDQRADSGEIDWTGSASVGASTGAMSGSDWRDYVLRMGFKRTDKDTELYECTTDAIQDMRRRFRFDEAKTETTTTDTITTLGDYKLTIETDFGMILGVLLEDDDTATSLIHVPKWAFNQMYEDINVTLDRGYPKHFTIFNGSIEIGPIPQDVSYSYRIAYSRRAGTVTSATDGVPFTDVMRDVLCDGTLGRLYKLLDEYERANYYFGEYERKFFESVRRERINSGEHLFQVKQLEI